jgi:hypothetical protein
MRPEKAFLEGVMRGWYMATNDKQGPSPHDEVTESIRDFRQEWGLDVETTETPVDPGCRAALDEMTRTASEDGTYFQAAKFVDDTR